MSGSGKCGCKEENIGGSEERRGWRNEIRVEGEGMTVYWGSVGVP